MRNFLKQLKRVGLDVVALLTILLLLIFVPFDFFPVEAKLGLLSLVITKFILVSAAVIHAHVTRKLLFPYIDFSREKNLSNNIMIIAWYVIIIFAWSRGG
jgi:hypothetical protein